MTFLYSCRTSGPSFRITKFTSDFEIESSYLCTVDKCECPASHRPMCRHREMLPKFLHRGHIDDGWFFDYDRGGWVQGPEHDVERITPALPPPSLEPPLSIFTNGNDVVTGAALLLRPEPMLAPAAPPPTIRRRV